ncbi:hypothetical protein HS088_TW12G00697 [Tripterygium wilfordii]|uniref:BHLH domain-containing protein n=1 Tax=Tripterygium wilfordii TaxID=458696 RepID=A0A7J7CZF2_TRIWF|nr:transcription factor bHLH96-like [Tripterygium wilfordii]KAF5739491.1 hypothetical protein HS088_TW12G00697 [Tripterygium wilfordii]
MALEAVVFPQGLFAHNSTQDLYNLLENNWSNHIIGLENEEEEEEKGISSFYFLDNQTDSWNSSISDFNSMQATNNAASDLNALYGDKSADMTTTTTTTIRPKRRRSRSRKNKEEIENQRMTHIAVERNRRKQMNEYLSVLRSLMPESYVRRGDQASIIGGAINFVKELEQRIHLTDAHKEIKAAKPADADDDTANKSQTFSEFFTFPQYSKSEVADVEVTMVETHANIKIRSKRRSKQLLKLVSGLQALYLTVLHLNVTTAQQIVLYSVSAKVEDECKLTSVDEIATAVYELLGRIQDNIMC